MKFLYPVYNPCADVIDVAHDWGHGIFDSTHDRELALQQPFSVAAVRAFYNCPEIFSFDPALANVSVAEFDLVLISDIEYFKHQDIERWATENHITNYLLAVGGIRPTDQLNPTTTIYRHYNIERYISRNQYVDTSGVSKPYLFDCLLGARRPHRDYVMLALTKTGLLDQSLVTYRTGFPGEIVNEYSEKYANCFPGVELNWPYVSPNLRSEWEVGSSVTNTNSCELPEGIFRKTHYSIICETLGMGNDFFLSEKTVKAMFSKRVFVVFGPKHFLKHLHNLGFQTFNAILDESYDNESVDEVRYQKAMLQVLRLAYFLTPEEVNHYVDYAVDNNARQLEYLKQSTDQAMLELLTHKISGRHWSR
jgi:hypothetical protein